MAISLDLPSEARVPHDLAAAELEKKFIRLRDKWKADRGYHSSVSKLAMHPAYQSVIGMGKEVVPLLLAELKTSVDYWFWALQAITEEDPVPPSDRGNWRKMAEAWIAWGSTRGSIMIFSM